MNSHTIITKYVEGLTQGLNNSLMIVGSAGTGKTETISTALKNLNLKEGQHFLYVANYCTPVELYNLLNQVNNLQHPRLLILDDVEDILTNKQTIGLLKSALWIANGHRKVYWFSGTYRIKEKEFEFKGKIIFLLNQFNKKMAILNALKDRSLFYEMELSRDEIIDLIKKRADEQPYFNIPQPKRKEIAEFIAKNSNDNLSLRTLQKVYQLFILSPNHYRELALKII